METGARPGRPRMKAADAFFALYSGLDREGPGLPADVLWALGVAGTREAADICDAGCGSGADTVTLAEARPMARITAIDIAPSLAAEARARAARFGDRVQVFEGDMAELPGRYDLIWCAGAAYFLGLEAALRGWRSALAPGGRIAVSEPCYPHPPTAAMGQFWQDEPGSVTDLAGIGARITATGYRSLGHRLLIGAPWAAYYAPLEAKIAKLRAAQPSPELSGVLNTNAREVTLWRAAPDDIAYALFVVAPA